MKPKWLSIGMDSHLLITVKLKLSTERLIILKMVISNHDEPANDLLPGHNTSIFHADTMLFLI